MLENIGYFCMREVGRIGVRERIKPCAAKPLEEGKQSWHGEGLGAEVVRKMTTDHIERLL